MDIKNLRRGFTLLEVLVAVAIIGIMSAIALPGLFGVLPKIRVNNAANNLLTDILWAKMHAVSENEDYVIAFGADGPDLSNNTYNIYKDENNNFSSNGVEANELVKTVYIQGLFKGIGFGYVDVDSNSNTIKKTNNSTVFPVLTNKNAVTLTTGSAVKPRWFKFSPSGVPNKLSTIYLIPIEDITTKRTDRMRAVSINIAGRVKQWKYSGNTWE